MAILDAQGNPISYSTKFARAADRGRAMPYSPTRLGDIEDLIPAVDWRTLVSASRALYTNMGLPKGAIAQIADLSVGDAFTPVFTGSDQGWGNAARDWLLNEWFPACDVRGPAFDFRTSLALDSVAIDRDGDVIVLKTEDGRGFPKVQHVPAHRIGNGSSRRGTVEGGKFDGARINNGIILDRIGATIGFRIVGGRGNGTEDLDVPASEVLHLFRPEWHDQNRGLPAALHAIAELISSAKSHQWEEMAMMMLSSIGLVEYNEHGGPDPNDPTTALSEDSDGNKNDGLFTTTFSGGMVRYMKANGGGKIDTIKSDRPGDAWDKFNDRIARNYCVGLGWSYSYAWKSGDLNGTSARTEIGKVNRATRRRQTLLRRAAVAQITYALSKAIDLRLLPFSPDWRQWDFPTPAQLSIDPGRDSKAGIEEWKAGTRNHTETLADKGRTLEAHYRERAQEIATRKRLAAEVSKREGVEIDDREMAMMTPNDKPDETEESNRDE